MKRIEFLKHWVSPSFPASNVILQQLILNQWTDRKWIKQIWTGVTLGILSLVMIVFFPVTSKNSPHVVAFFLEIVLAIIVISFTLLFLEISIYHKPETPALDAFNRDFERLQFETGLSEEQISGLSFEQIVTAHVMPPILKIKNRKGSLPPECDVHPVAELFQVAKKFSMVTDEIKPSILVDYDLKRGIPS